VLQRHIERKGLQKSGENLAKLVSFKEQIKNVCTFKNLLTLRDFCLSVNLAQNNLGFRAPWGLC
jgi:hypothetical protein